MRPGEPGHRRCGACRSCHRGSLLGTKSPTAVTPQWEPWNLFTRRAGPLVQRSVWVRPRWQDMPVSAAHPFTAPFLSFQVGHCWTNRPVGARQDHPVRMRSPGLSEVDRSRVCSGGLGAASLRRPLRRGCLGPGSLSGLDLWCSHVWPCVDASSTSGAQQVEPEMSGGARSPGSHVVC